MDLEKYVAFFVYNTLTRDTEITLKLTQSQYWNTVLLFWTLQLLEVKNYDTDWSHKYTHIRQKIFEI